MNVDSDQTMVPRRTGAVNLSDDVTMPGARERKPDGRFEPGDLILGRYQVVSELGQGGMGVVYKCFDETAGVEIALKALPPELSHNSLEMEDIKDNFQLVAKLVHQNIAISKTLEKDASNGNYYLIMECVDGEDLRRWIKRKRKDGSLTLDAVIPVIRQVAEALDYAHREKVMHRDIKPGNIMINAEGKVKVLDFGLAAQIHTSMTRVSMAYRGTSGTGPYMAPEQWRGRPQGAPADQYALAVMAYEMLAGHLPFESTDAAVLREAVLNDDPEPLKDVSAFVISAITRAMSKEPAGRFVCCQDFVSALSGREVASNKTKDDGSSSRLKVLLTTAVAGVLLVGGGMLAYQHHAEKQATRAAEEARKIAERKAAAEEKVRREQEAKELETLRTKNLKHRSGLKLAEDTLNLDTIDQGQAFGEKIRLFRINYAAGLEASSNAGDLAAQRMANKMFSDAKGAVDWIALNSKRRETAKGLLNEVESKKRAADEFGVPRLAAEIYAKASKMIVSANGAYERGEFESAIKGLRQGLAAYTEAYAHAHRIMLDDLDKEIKAAQEAKNWRQVAECAEKMRPWDMEKSRKLAAEAEEQLKAEEVARKCEKPGYVRDGDVGVKWKAGLTSDKYPHWISAEDEACWYPVDGYKRENPEEEGLGRLVWDANWKGHGKRATNEEGVFEYRRDCINCDDGKVSCRVDCSECNGSGWKGKNADCSSCKGSGKVARDIICRNCNGSRKELRNCPGCGPIQRNGICIFTHGQVCDNCQGNGMVRYEPQKKDYRGQGVIPGLLNAVADGFKEGIRSSRAQSNGGWERCTRCNGFGAYHHSACNGSGYIQVACSKCNGTGSQCVSGNCSSCSGTGKWMVSSSCSRCLNGKIEGEKDCRKCNGLGYVWSR